MRPTIRLLAALAARATLGVMLPVTAGAQQFRWCDDVLPNCTTVTLTVTPPAPGTPPYYPGFPAAATLTSHTVHSVDQLTLHDPDYGDVYFGPYGFYRLLPVFWPGGGGFFPGFIDDAPWLFGGTEIWTEGTYTVNDMKRIIGPGAIHGLYGESYRGDLVRFTPLSVTAPEPSSLALLVGGVSGLAFGGAWRRRRRRADAQPRPSADAQRRSASRRIACSVARRMSTMPGENVAQ